MLIELLTIVAPVFVITGIGALWGRRGQRFDTETVGLLVFLVGTPCLIFATFTSLTIELKSFANMAAAAIISLAIAAVLSYAALRTARLSLRSFMPSLMHANSGNIGIPVVFLAFGEEGLALAVSFFFVIALSQYTIGYAFASGRLTWRQVSRQPLIWAVVLSLAVLLTGFAPPDWVAKTTTLLGNITIPLMLILLGVSLSRIRPHDLKLSLLLAGLRLVIGIASGVGAIVLLDLDGPERGTVFLQASMPAAIFGYVFAERFKRDPEKVASLVFVSTVLTLLAMPLLVWAALRMA